MKKAIVISAVMMIGLSFMCATASFAQNNADASILNFKKELSLTDKQEKNIRGINTKLQSTLAAATKELAVLTVELNKMAADNADLGRIRVKLEKMGKLRADATYENVASIRAIEKELTSAQLAKWRDIQKNIRKLSPQTPGAPAAQAANKR